MFSCSSHQYVNRCCRHRGASSRRHRWRVAAAKNSWDQQLESFQRNALDKAVSVVNRFISKKDWLPPEEELELGDAWGIVGVPDYNPALLEQEKPRYIKIEAKTSVHRAVEEHPENGIAEYLKLPIKDYNSLDPNVVRHLGGNRFLLTPPFKAWFKIDLKPEITLRIQPQPEHSRVMFVCERVKFGAESIDNAGKLFFVSALSRAVKAGDNEEDQETYFVSAARVELSVAVRGRVAKVAPVAALQAVFNRVLEATLTACSRPYLDRIAEDYRNWAEGKARTEGDISPLHPSEVLDNSMLEQMQLDEEELENIMYSGESAGWPVDVPRPDHLK